ncbi:MAG: T9SS type A sorting domain-containing protein [Bacteroidota bacterium]
MKASLQKYLKISLTILIICLMIDFSINYSYSQSQGVNSPVWVLTSGCNSCPGSTWVNAVNVEHNDNLYATATLLPFDSCSNHGDCYFTKDFYSTDYGFHIPASATIVGIEVTIVKKSGVPNSIIDSVVKLLKNNLQVGVNFASTEYYNINDSVYYYGGPTDLWGASWTPADINNSLFGVAFKPINKSLIRQSVSLNWIGIKVYYSIATAVNSVVSSNSEFSFSYDSYNHDLSLTTNFSDDLFNSNITIFDMLGNMQYKKEIKTIPNGPSKNNFKINTLANGLYIVEFNADNKQYIKKILIRN